jgi:hypothetical protein
MRGVQRVASNGEQMKLSRFCSVSIERDAGTAPGLDMLLPLAEPIRGLGTESGR